MRKLWGALRLVPPLIFGTNLAALRLVSQPHTAAEYVLNALFAYRIAARSGIERRSLWQILDCDPHQPVAPALLGFGDLDHWQSTCAADILYLSLATRMVQPEAVFEIGTNFGITAAHFALNSDPTARIYTLDLPRDARVRPKLPTTAFDDIYIRDWRTVGLKIQQHDAFERIEYLTGDSASFDFTSYEGKIDLFFVDGAHSYEYVRHDTRSALRCCRPGGVIIWDDYGRYGLDGVTRHIDELARQLPIYRIANTALAIHVVTS